MAVTRLEIHKRQPYANSQAFGDTGAYEQIFATAFFNVDPTSRDNNQIADIELANMEQDGSVSFSANVCILQPKDTEKGNKTLYVDVPNRGRDRSLNLLNSSNSDQIANPGNGFLMRQGYTIAWCGWQHDVPDAESLMKLHGPIADVSGKIAVNIQTNTISYSEELSERGHQPYPTADLSNHCLLYTSPSPRD